MSSGRKGALVIGPADILNRVCEPVGPREDTSQLQRIMERACKQDKTGVGLAAPQVGVAKRLIFLNCRDARGTIRGRFLFNPAITETSRSRNLMREGCLSYPGIFKTIPRPDWVQLEYQRHPSVPAVSQRFEAFEARVICHEVDHLEGICLVGDPNYPGEGEAPRPAAERRGANLNVPLMAAAVIGMSLTLEERNRHGGR